MDLWAKDAPDYGPAVALAEAGEHLGEARGASPMPYAMDGVRAALDRVGALTVDNPRQLSSIGASRLLVDQASAEIARDGHASDVTLVELRGQIAVMRGAEDGLMMGRVREGAPFAVLFADVNGLKRINDTLGHDQGDRVIAAAAQVLRAPLRQGDVLARLGVGSAGHTIYESKRSRVASATLSVIRPIGRA